MENLRKFLELFDINSFRVREIEPNKGTSYLTIDEIEQKIQQGAYLSFLPEEQHGEDKKTNIRTFQSIVLDLDPKNENASAKEVEAAIKRMREEIGISPSAIVFSGRGYHIYYLFERQDISPDQIEYSEEVRDTLIQKAQQYFKNFEVDKQGRLLSQGFRVPYSINSKTGKQSKVIFITKDIGANRERNYQAIKQHIIPIIHAKFNRGAHNYPIFDFLLTKAGIEILNKKKGTKKDSILLKNMAIYLYKQEGEKRALEKLEKFSQAIGHTVGEARGWIKKVKKGELKAVNLIEVRRWVVEYYPELINLAAFEEFEEAGLNYRVDVNPKGIQVIIKDESGLPLNGKTFSLLTVKNVADWLKKSGLEEDYARSIARAIVERGISLQQAGEDAIDDSVEVDGNCFFIGDKIFYTFNHRGVHYVASDFGVETMKVEKNPIFFYNGIKYKLMKPNIPTDDMQVFLSPKGKERLNSSEVVGSEIYEKLKAKLKEFTDMEEPYYDILTLWILHTYLFNIQGNTFYLYFVGERGTGKTTTLQTLNYLVWNGLLTTYITPSALFRSVDANQCTVLYDEADKYLNRKENREIIGVFNAGTTRGLSVPRVEKEGDRFTVKMFRSFSPKAFTANDFVFDDTTRSRTIEMVMLRTAKKDLKKISLVPSLEEELRALRDLKDDIAIWAIHNARKVYETYVDMVRGSLLSRENDNFLLVKSIAKVIGLEDGMEWESIMQKSSILSLDELDMNARMGIAIFHILLDYADQRKFDTVIEVSLDDILEAINSREIREKYMIPEIKKRSLTRPIKMLGLDKFKTVIDKRVHIHMDKDILKKMVNRSGYVEILDNNGAKL